MDKELFLIDYIRDQSFRSNEWYIKVKHAYIEPIDVVINRPEVVDGEHLFIHVHW